MARVRTFIALDPGAKIREHLVALQESLARSGADVKWVEPENLHITLLFLGEVDERDVVNVCKAVAETSLQQPAFELAIEGTGCFPNMRRPRIVWVGAGQGAQEAKALHAALEKPLLKLGCYRREDRPFTPHITLGRIRTDKPMSELAAALQKMRGFEAGTTAIKDVRVMSSELGPEGPRYTVMSRCPLG